MSTFQHAISTISALVPLVSATSGRASARLPLVGSGSLAGNFSEATNVAQTPPWRALVNLRAEAIRDLQPGWDGAASIVPATATIAEALRFASDALVGLDSGIAPYLVPAGDGSIQLEWHEAHGELEFLIESDGEVSIWARLHLSEFEGRGEEAIALFYRWAPWLATHHDDGVDVSRQTQGIILQIAA